MKKVKNLQECFVRLFDLICDKVFSKEEHRIYKKPLGQWRAPQFEAFAEELDLFMKAKGQGLKSDERSKLSLSEKSSRTRFKKHYTGIELIKDIDNKNISDRLNMYCEFLHNKNPTIPDNWIDFVQDYCQLPYYNLQNKVTSQLSGNIHQLQELAVKQYYVQAFKLRKNFGSLLFRGLGLSKEHLLSFDLLKKCKNTALIGSSGIGKSAFAQKCCLDWANSKHQEAAFISLYVDLSDKAYEGGLKAYLVNLYFSAHNPIDVNDFFDSKDQYILLLDSFDTLSSDQQIKLIEHVSKTYDRYLVLSQHTDLVPFEHHFNEVYELTGLGETGVDMFITNQFTGKPEEEVAAFLKIIEDNHVLNQLKRRPRYLGQMIDIFKASVAKDALKKVKSSAGLARLHSRLKEVE